MYSELFPSQSNTAMPQNGWALKQSICQNSFVGYSRLRSKLRKGPRTSERGPDGGGDQGQYNEESAILDSFRGTVAKGKLTH